MGIKLTLKREITIPEGTWMSKADWEATYRDNLPAFLALLLEDLQALLEDMGGIEGVIERAEWVDR